MRRLYCILGIIWLLSACTPAPIPPTITPIPTPTPTPRSSAWGDVELVAQAEQTHAPDILSWFGGKLLVWTGADNNEARHYMQGRTQTSILALKAFYPFEQQLYPADTNDVRMLWLDSTERDSRELRLLAGVVSQDAVAEFGPNPVSQIRTRHYDGLVQNDNRLLAIWSGGTGVINNLYINHIDVRGRPTSATLVRQSADYPVIVQSSLGIEVFWLQDNGRDAYRSRYLPNIEPPSLQEPQGLTRLGREYNDLAIENFYVGMDSTHMYLFWQMWAVDGTRQVLFSSGSIADNDFSDPAPLAITPDETRTVQTTYNSGTVYAAQNDGMTAEYAIPLKGQHSVLPIAISMDNRLGIAYFADGQLLGYQDVVQTEALIGEPSIEADRDRHLYLAWSEPTEFGYADLLTVTTRR